MGTFAALATVGGFVMFSLFALLALCALAWMLVRDHIDAQKYRALVKEAQKQKVEPQQKSGYKMVYKEGRAQKTVQLPGNTEIEAMQAAARMQLKWSSIVSLEKL